MLREGASALPALDARADACLDSADRLVSALEAAGSAEVHAINLCGRQRMLSQRVAKQALLGQPPDAAVAEFEAALRALRGLPLTTHEIAAALDGAEDAWSELLAATRAAADADARRVLGTASDSLLDAFDDLTARYERSLQRLIR